MVSFSTKCVTMERIISKQLLITLLINHKRKRDPSKMIKDRVQCVYFISNRTVHEVTVAGIIKTKLTLNLLVLFFIIKVNIPFLYYP